MIRTIIREIEAQTKLPMFPSITDSIGECIVYSYEPVSDNGVVRKDRLTLRIIAETLPKVNEIDDMLRNILITIGDEKKIEGIFDCYVSGGGVLRDTDTHYYHSIKYYYITIKSEVNI